MSAIEKSLERCRAFVSSRRHEYQAAKAAAIGQALNPGGGVLGPFGESYEQRRTASRYGSFKGWTYSTINLLATRAMSQPVCVGKLLGGAEPEEPKRKIGSAKGLLATATVKQKMPLSLRSKAATQEVEIYLAHPALDMLKSNPLQTCSQLTYMFVANLALTGRAYVIYDETKEGPTLYCLPSSWVQPNHEKGPYSRFKIVDPKAAGQGGDSVWFDRSQVGMAFIPDPSDPMGAISPVGSQAAAIRIDENIQECQQNFFKNGIFPSVIISMGRTPHPDVPAGVRPRLTGAQRQQIHGVINRMYADAQNYGTPVIVDEIVESVEPLNRSQDEIGWEKSEGTVRNRIVSPFGVHPFMMGEAINVGGYAQAAVIERQFYERINSYLAMLSELVTKIYADNTEGEEQIQIWWEECVARDDSLYSQDMREGRKTGDVKRNEYRAYLGLPPDEDATENRAPLRETQAGINGAVQILSAMGQGFISADSATALLATFFQIDETEARRLVGGGVAPQPVSEPEALGEAVGALSEAVRALGLPPAVIADRIMIAAS